MDEKLFEKLHGVWHPADSFLNIDLILFDLAHGTALVGSGELMVMLTWQSSENDAAFVFAFESSGQGVGYDKSAGSDAFSQTLCPLVVALRDMEGHGWAMLTRTRDNRGRWRQSKVRGRCQKQCKWHPRGIYIMRSVQLRCHEVVER